MCGQLLCKHTWCARSLINKLKDRLYLCFRKLTEGLPAMSKTVLELVFKCTENTFHHPNMKVHNKERLRNEKMQSLISPFSSVMMSYFFTWHLHIVKFTKM